MKQRHTGRRTFLKTLGIAGAAAFAGLPALALRDSGLQKITLLHTNDTHSRIDPYPSNDPVYPGMGGYARRAALIRNYREQDSDLLVVDAGDIFQGTPYFNIYGGEPELRLMSKMGYDAAAFGNHEFDNGLDGFLEVLPLASFPFLVANYDFSQTLLAGKTREYTVVEKAGVRIGLYGLGIEFEGLVARNLYGDTNYLDPIEKARETEQILKLRHHCKLVVCLSHLGFDYQGKKVSDTTIGQNTRHTDIIIGGHTHDLLNPPARVRNLQQQPVVIGQAGSGGTYMGKMEIYFSQGSDEVFIEANTINL